MTPTAQTQAPDIEITIQLDTSEGKEGGRLPAILSQAEM